MPVNRKLVFKALSTVAVIGGLLLIESKYPLRKPVEAKGRRWLRNLAITSIGALLLRSVEVPVVGSLSKMVERRRIGILNQIHLPRLVYLVSAVALMDYTLYIWHALVHRLPFLWRFHEVHHADLDMDMTTSNRFHFGELAISILWRAMQVCVIGINPLALRIWQSILTLSIVFHHANIRIPGSLDEKLSRFIVTPKLHEVHHSVLVHQTNSNFSSGLTLWDRLHGTYRAHPNQATVIGNPRCLSVDQVGLTQMLALPFESRAGCNQ